MFWDIKVQSLGVVHAQPDQSWFNPWVSIDTIRWASIDVVEWVTNDDTDYVSIDSLLNICIMIAKSL